MKNTTIEEISQMHRCKPEHLNSFIEWILDNPTSISSRIRKYIIMSLIGYDDALPSESIMIDTELLIEIGELEHTANLLQELGEYQVSAMSAFVARNS